MSFYKLLEVHSDASSEEIRKAFKRVALKYHPDKGGDVEIFKLCVQALETLSDTDKRAVYDQSPSQNHDHSNLKTCKARPAKTTESDPRAMTVSELKLLLGARGIYHDDCSDKTELLLRLSRQIPFVPLRVSFTAAELVDAPRVKIISLGCEAVGKSCLIKRFCEGKFVERYISTIGVDYGVRPLEICKARKYVIKINFFDFSGLRSFADVRSEFYENTQGILLVFDVSSLQSFRNISDWVTEASCYGIKFGSGGSRHAVLIGNKCDSSRVVTCSEARAMAEKLGVKYFETSALTGEGVNDAFVHLASQIAD